MLFDRFFCLILISDIVKWINISIDIYITLFICCVFIMIRICFGLGQFIYRFNNGCLGRGRWVENFRGYNSWLCLIICWPFWKFGCVFVSLVWDRVRYISWIDVWWFVSHIRQHCRLKLTLILWPGPWQFKHNSFSVRKDNFFQFVLCANLGHEFAKWFSKWSSQKRQYRGNDR